MYVILITDLPRVWGGDWVLCIVLGILCGYGEGGGSGRPSQGLHILGSI